MAFHLSFSLFLPSSSPILFLQQSHFHSLFFIIHSPRTPQFLTIHSFGESDVQIHNMCKVKESDEKTNYSDDWEMGFRFSDEHKVEKLKNSITVSRPRMKLWMTRAITTVLLWTCFLHLMALGDLFNHQSSSSLPYKVSLPPKRTYKNNGFLMVSCNGGLNQMRAAICDMVSIARYLNLTLIVPNLDKTSFWADPSDFEDIFDVDQFISSLRDEVRILRKLPPKIERGFESRMIYSLSPISWSNLSYYLNEILPLVKKYKVVHLNKTDARLANNGLPIGVQKLRCRVNFNALRFTSPIEELGRKVVQMLRNNGPFLVLHLRYEMDMLAFSGCTRGCNNDEVNELTRMRYDYPWWKDKVIDSELKRKEGLCPLTPEETSLVLSSLEIDRNVHIYIASGEIYGGERRMESLASSFPNLVRKETLLKPLDLRFFQNHSSQMAALDYLVSLESDIFVPTYDGNMARVVEGHRRFLGFKKTILLNRKLVVSLIDQYNNGTLAWDEFSSAMKEAHSNRSGSSKKRVVIPNRPKEEDYFYSNPHECLEEPLRSL